MAKIKGTEGVRSCGLVINVLGYEEDGEWVALALEMDLRGYGTTPNKAMKELIELVQMQISFANFKKQPEMIWKDAEPHWFRVFEKAKVLALKALMKAAGVMPSTEFSIDSLRIPPAHMLSSIEFNRTCTDAENI